jgi:hypothetical protein
MCNYILGTAPSTDGDKVMNNKLKSHANTLINRIFYEKGSREATDASIQREIDTLKERMTEAEADMYIDGSVCCHEYEPHSADEEWNYLMCKHCGDKDRQPIHLERIYPVTNPPPGVMTSLATMIGVTQHLNKTLAPVIMPILRGYNPYYIRPRRGRR